MTRPNKRHPLTLVAMFALVALIAAACGGRDDDTTTGGGGDGEDGGGEALVADPADCEIYDGEAGVTEDTIKIGTSAPISGAVAAFGKPLAGMRAYIDYINAQGGVDGRQIELIAEDDQYDPNLTLQNVQKLVEEDNVFALVGVIGTPNNLAIRDYLAENCVPSLAVATGSPKWGDVENYPWMIGGLPSYAAEATLFAEYLKENQPDAKVAVIFQNDDFGKPYVEAFKNAIEGTDIEIVGEESYDIAGQADTTAQVTTLADTDADAFLVAATTTCPNILGQMPDDWEPTTYVSIVCTSRTLMALAGDAAIGAYSARATLDPADPANAEDEGIAFFLEEGPKYGLTEEDLGNLNVAIGWSWGEWFVDMLEESPALTRADVMNTAWAQQDQHFGVLLPEVLVNTNGVEDPWAIEQLQLIRWDGQAWVPEGEVVSFEGETNTFADPTA
ncbi:MAG: hypothetical protein JJLCMIEE_02746 [Acidimicrobiales bacterium]|nr:MAG: hypothetical protein EDR02_14600 [Actinomycetota bacterium]MBV6509650.1 hypothetical protein [Acidimicrobiales bacterium]RIK06342.1 MAG: hypothetical protein DCC48_07925 [Acidobacteriota bacterium]